MREGKVSNLESLVTHIMLEAERETQKKFRDSK